VLGRDQLGDLAEDGRIVLRKVSITKDTRALTEFI
jgi:hypothetical protein